MAPGFLQLAAAGRATDRMAHWMGRWDPWCPSTANTSDLTVQQRRREAAVVADSAPCATPAPNLQLVLEPLATRPFFSSLASLASVPT